MASGKIAEFFGLAPKKTTNESLAAAPVEVEERAIVEACIALQEKHGISTDSSRQELLKIYLHESGIDVYPLEKVEAYMTAKLGGENYADGWRWFALNARDADSDRRRVYADPVPLPVLMLIDRIAGEFPGAIFEVAAKSVPHRYADPFLSVRMQLNQERIVVERWDEPGFRS